MSDSESGEFTSKRAKKLYENLEDAWGEFETLAEILVKECERRESNKEDVEIAELELKRVRKELHDANTQLEKVKEELNNANKDLKRVTNAAKRVKLEDELGTESK